MSLQTPLGIAWLGCRHVFVFQGGVSRFTPFHFVAQQVLDKDTDLE